MHEQSRGQLKPLSRQRDFGPKVSENRSNWRGSLKGGPREGPSWGRGASCFSRAVGEGLTPQRSVVGCCSHAPPTFCPLLDCPTCLQVGLSMRTMVYLPLHFAEPGSEPPPPLLIFLN